MHPDRLEALRGLLSDSTSRRRALGLLGVGAGLAVAGQLSETEAARKNAKKAKKAKRSEAQPELRPELPGDPQSGSGGGENPHGRDPFEGMTGIPVNANATQGVKFVGLLDITNFYLDPTETQILADGVLTGEWLDNKGNPVETEGVSAAAVENLVGVPVNIRQATCQILFLDLGPIHLELLGLVLDVSRITIRLTAVPGGGLLGDLLCSIANLLNGGLEGFLQDIVDALNDILDLLALPAA